MVSTVLIILSFTFTRTTCLALTEAETGSVKEKRMQWFKDAKLGVFIHWGIYAVNGIDESWSFFNGYISYNDYMKQLKGFTAKKYDPGYWARLIKESGAKYAVLTAKHHDGVALWNTRQSHLNTLKKTPARADLVTPFCKAMRKEGLKAGLYFSILDWSHPDYPNFTRKEKRYDPAADEKRWWKFVDFNFRQLKELSTQFNPDLFWFDGDWEFKPEQWKSKEIRELLVQHNPNVIINSRIGGGYGDYATPEQGMPVTRPGDQYWELCLTMNDSWGYQPNDKNYKSSNQLIRIFIDTISMGGNLLLDIGPKADGTIPRQQIDTLKEFGRWTTKHKEAIYHTKAGIPHGHFYGPTTLSKEEDRLYLFLPHKPNGPVVIKGLKNKINRIWVVGNGTKLRYKILGKQYWSDVPGLLYIDVPEAVLDPQVTVLCILLKNKIQLYRQQGHTIESN